MAYFDGDMHGIWTASGYKAGKPHTCTLCDDCAEEELPLKPRGEIGRHWDTGFKWAPTYGAPCDKCGRRC